MVGESVQAATATITVSPAPSSQTPVATNCGGSVAFYNCPGTVWVAAGETTASFTFQAGLVTQPTTATVTATLGGTASASLTVTPPTHTISASPLSIICGSTQSSTVTITLAVAVRQGSTATFTITRSTSPPATVYFYTIPTYVHIQGGQTTGSFTFQTGGAISQTTVLSITATYASAQTAEVTLEPPQLSLSLSPGSLFGGSGQKSTGTVTFSAPVRDTTGVSMSRTPSTPNLFNTFPTWVNIPAGGSSGTFSFEAAATTSAATITITATWGTSASAQLVVYPGNPDLGPCKDCNAQGGHPINLTNGNVWLQQRDYSLPGLAGGIELVRTWNSLWLTSSPIEISGSVKKVRVWDCPPGQTCWQYDTGGVSITVNGFNATVYYAQGSTAAGIANGLANIFNTNPSSPVTATVSVSTVYLTAKTTGSATNYPLTATSWTDDPFTFGSPSFTATRSGPTLTGGSDGSPGEPELPPFSAQAIIRH